MHKVCRCRINEQYIILLGRAILSGVLIGVYSDYKKLKVH